MDLQYQRMMTFLVGAPEGNDFYVAGMGGVLLCKDGELHPKQTRLGGVL